MPKQDLGYSLGEPNQLWHYQIELRFFNHELALDFWNLAPDHETSLNLARQHANGFLYKAYQAEPDVWYADDNEVEYYLTDPVLVSKWPIWIQAIPGQYRFELVPAKSK